MAASQGRLLSITARMSDVEFSSQQIQQKKIELAMSTDQITQQYTDALNKTKFVGLTGFNNGSAVYQDLNYDMLTGLNSPLAGDYCVTDSSNKIVIPQSMADKLNKSKNVFDFMVINGVDQNAASTAASGGAKTPETTYYTNLYNKISQGYTVRSDANLNSAEWMSNQIKNGGLFLEKFGTDGTTTDQDWESSGEISEKRDTKDLDIIEAKYNADLQKIQTQDKKYDMNLKQLDSEHSALQTEADSVKKVIEKNIESSFKTFG